MAAERMRLLLAFGQIGGQDLPDRFHSGWVERKHDLHPSLGWGSQPGSCSGLSDDRWIDPPLLTSTDDQVWRWTRAKVGPNELRCCGSSLKAKRCCLAEPERRTRTPRATRRPACFAFLTLGGLTTACCDFT